MSGREQRLEAVADQRWAPNLLRLGVHHDGPPGLWSPVVFDRGFPGFVSVWPEVFLEYRELIFRLAPLRAIHFESPWDEDAETYVPIPLDDILACPELARLDFIGFSHVLPEKAFEKLAACPHLTALKILRIEPQTEHGSTDIAALCEGPITKKLLRVDSMFHIGEYEVRDCAVGLGDHTKTYFSDRAGEIEERIGYVPWFHPSHNQVGWHDVRSRIESGELPKYPPGSLPPKPEWYDVPIKFHREY